MKIGRAYNPLVWLSTLCLDVQHLILELVVREDRQLMLELIAKSALCKEWWASFIINIQSLTCRPAFNYRFEPTLYKKVIITEDQQERYIKFVATLRIPARASLIFIHLKTLILELYKPPDELDFVLSLCPEIETLVVLHSATYSYSNGARHTAIFPSTDAPNRPLSKGSRPWNQTSNKSKLRRLSYVASYSYRPVPSTTFLPPKDILQSLTHLHVRFHLEDNFHSPYAMTIVSRNDLTAIRSSRLHYFAIDVVCDPSSTRKYLPALLDCVAPSLPPTLKAFILLTDEFKSIDTDSLKHKFESHPNSLALLGVLTYGPIPEDFDGRPVRLGGGISIILHERASFLRDWCQEDIEAEGKKGPTIWEMAENVVTSRKLPK
jgi:hypothetical protein